MTRSVPVRAAGSQPGARTVLRRSSRSGLVGESPPILALRQAIETVARTRASVLVTGETGTGKGLVARCIHELSGEAAFVHVDCASLSPTIIESELFGHERGAFTGAVERRIGRLERAGTGTVFLDEVADVEPRLQAKLLRVLQDRVFERVGGGETLRLRARVVAATNRDLLREIEAGRFRADLYYRLQVVEMHVPPLRHRLGDLPSLVAHLCRGLGRSPEIRPSFHARLRRHEWPGNVRELGNCVERLALVKPGGPWEASDLDGVLRAGTLGGARSLRSPRERFEERERAALGELLSAHGWNVSAAARSLGISRGALRGRIARLKL